MIDERNVVVLHIDSFLLYLRSVTDSCPFSTQSTASLQASRQHAQALKQARFGARVYMYSVCVGVLYIRAQLNQWLNT